MRRETWWSFCGGAAAAAATPALVGGREVLEAVPVGIFVMLFVAWRLDRDADNDRKGRDG